MPAFNRWAHRVHSGHLPAQRLNGDAEHLALQDLNDRRSVRLVLDQHGPRVRIQPPHRPDGRQRPRKIQMPVQAISQIIVVPALAPNRDRHEVVVLRALERRVHRNDLRAEARHGLRIIKSPPVPPHQISAFNARRALVERHPRPRPALRVGEIRPLEFRKPLRILPQLRAQRLAGLPAHRIMLFRLDRQPHQLHIRLALQDPRRQIILMPRRHDHNDLRARSQTGFQGILPFLPDLVPRRLGIGLLPVLHRVVDQNEICRIARNAGEQAARDDAPHPVAQLQLRRPVYAADLNAEQVLSEPPDLLLVPPQKPLREALVVRRHDDPRLRMLSQIPARDGFRHRHAFPVLRRRLD